MTSARIVLPALVLAFAEAVPAPAQSVVSTHSGLIYFFEGSVFLGDQPLEQKFGKFPDIGVGGELRTQAGRAEVLLTPGVVLRVDQNSAIRLVSDKLSDTRVELLAGSSILEADEAPADTSARMVYKNWTMQVPKQGVYRLDSQPAQVLVYKGEVDVSAEGQGSTAVVHNGEVLPLAEVLITEQSAASSGDAFKNWAMGRSDAIAADNAIAAGIVDDPDKIDTAGLGLGGFSYFPLTGVPSLGITNPYGLSFWSPYQASLSSIYFPAYRYGLGYPGWPTGIRLYPRPIGSPSRIGIGTGFRPGYINTSPRAPYTPLPRIGPPPSASHAATPHAGVGIHGGRR